MRCGSECTWIYCMFQRGWQIYLNQSWWIQTVIVFNTTAQRCNMYFSPLELLPWSCCLHLLLLFLSVRIPCKCVSGRHLIGSHHVTDSKKVANCGPEGIFVLLLGLKNKVAPFPARSRMLTRLIIHLWGWLCWTDSTKSSFLWQLFLLN